jgi:branched-chain amino acid transport system substrate-binding protein
MISVSSRSCATAFSSALRTLVVGLFLTLALGGCRTGWNSFDNMVFSSPAPQTQTAQPPAVSAKTVAKPAAKATVNGPALSSGMAASRLESQPWPTGMGQPLPPGSAGTQTAMATNRPLPVPAQPYAAQEPHSGKIQVAVLLPLSGKNAPLGQAMLNAAQMAVFDVAPSHFELMPRDTGGNAEGAENAARDAIASGARLLIGPLFAADVAAVKPVVQTSNVNMLALSTDVSLAEPGVYVMGFAPAPQVERVIAYAASQGAHRFAALIPANAYGKLVQQAFEASVRGAGGTIVAMESLSHVQALLEKRDQIDALLLPLGGEELRVMASQLKAGGIDHNKTHLLGTGLWDEPGLGSRLDMLVGGWYAAAEPEAREAFVENYKKTYGQEPPRLATLTYDATSLAAALAMQGGHFDRASLTNPSGFSGIDGIFRLTRQGEAERGLAVNEITIAGSRIIDPSPSTFAGMTTVSY